MFEYQNTPRVLLMPMFVQWGDEPAAVKEPEEEPETLEEHPEEEEPEASLEEGETGEGEETEPAEPVAVAVEPEQLP